MANGLYMFIPLKPLQPLLQPLLYIHYHNILYLFRFLMKFAIALFTVQMIVRRTMRIKQHRYQSHRQLGESVILDLAHACGTLSGFAHVPCFPGNWCCKRPLVVAPRRISELWQPRIHTPWLYRCFVNQGGYPGYPKSEKLDNLPYFEPYPNRCISVCQWLVDLVFHILQKNIEIYYRL